MRIGIFGGSFNPIHNGHIALACRIRQLAKLDEIWFVVSPHNPLKSADGLMPDADRLNMVRIALSGTEGLVASDYEFHLPRPSYMLNTLQHLSADYPDDSFHLIIGADNWACFNQWHGYEEIIRNYGIFIYPREGTEIDAASLPSTVRFLDTGLYNISSTEVRQLLSEGKSIAKLVPPQVAGYISSHNLLPVAESNAASSTQPSGGMPCPTADDEVLISVIVPIYNKAEYVEDCLLSILTQDFPSFEVIAVEDGSKDNSGEICDRIAAEHPNITVLHPENGGVTAARRLGYEHSRGKYITFVDADDKMLPCALRRLYEEIESTGADEVVARYINQYDELCGHEGGKFMQPSWMIKELLASRAGFCVLWAVLFRRELLEGCLNTPRKIRSGEDILMQIICLTKNPKVWFSDEVVYMYNMGLPNDRTLNLDDEMLYDDILLRLFRDRMDEYGPYIVLHQTKMYENFIYERQYDALPKYYRFLRKADKSRLSLADRIAIMLPPCIAHYPIAMKKNRQMPDRTRLQAEKG